MAERLGAARPLIESLAILGLASLVIWVVLDSPPDYDPCNDEAPPGQPGDLREWRYPSVAIMLGVGAFTAWRLLAWSASARERRGGDRRPGAVAIAATAVGAALGLVALGGSIDVAGDDNGGIGWLMVLLLVYVLPVLALAFAAVLISLLTPGDGWRASLDRTGPFALAALLVIGLPFLCGVIIAYGGDAALC